MSKDREFSTPSAYEHLLNLPENHNGDVYKLIWSWSGPKRVRIHLWKMTQGAIVTNMFRQKRGITPLGTCPMCELEEVSLENMTHDYRGSMHVWSSLAGNFMPSNFFDTNLHSWMLENLRCTPLIHGLEWNIIFGAAASCIWQARNNGVFHEEVATVKVICCKALHLAWAFHQSKTDNIQTSSLLNRVSHNNIKWGAPSFGSWKLNCDGVVCSFGIVSSTGSA